MRTPGKITFMCLIMFFVVSIDPEDPIKWHNFINALAALSCGILSIITEINTARGRKHLISGSSKSGGLFDVI